jgi:hypothetical protein
MTEAIHYKLSSCGRCIAAIDGECWHPKTKVVDGYRPICPVGYVPSWCPLGEYPLIVCLDEEARERTK